MNLYNLHNDPQSLKGFENRQTHVPALLKQSMNDRQLTDHQLKKVKGDPVLSYLYAVILKHPWAIGEKAIATDATTAFKYALTILKRPWPPGEEAIAKDPLMSLRYAKDVLNTAFPLGEKAISKDAKLSFRYARHLRDRFPKGEPMIATIPSTSIPYAEEIIKGRFPAGEDLIVTDKYAALRYAKNVIKGKWPEGEKAIDNQWTRPQYNEMLKSHGYSGDDLLSDRD